MVTVTVPTSHTTTQGTSIEERERTNGHHFRLPGGRQLSGSGRVVTTYKTVRRVIAAHEAGEGRPERAARVRNFDQVTELVTGKVKDTRGRISAKRLLPQARAAGYDGSPRNCRRLVAQGRRTGARGQATLRATAGVWAPGEHLLIDWGVRDGLHVFCAVLAWARVRFVRFATDETAATTFAMLAECFEVLGWGTPGGARRPDGLFERRGGGECGDPDPRLCPVRHPLRVPAGLLRGPRPGIQRHGRTFGRLRQTGPDDPPRPVHRPDGRQHRGRRLVC